MHLLTAEDITELDKKLKEFKIRIIIVSFSLLLILFPFSIFVFTIMDTSNNEILFGGIILSIFIIDSITLYFLYKPITLINKDKVEATKILETKILKKKSSRLNINNEKIHYLFFNSQDYLAVKESEYEIYKINDPIKVYIAKNSKIVLSIYKDHF
jgi:hypothetical protein